MRGVIELFALIVQTADDKGWLSNEHFSVDGTLIQAWASYKSSVRKGGKNDDDDDNNNAGANFKGQTRSNDTHASSTDGVVRRCPCHCCHNRLSDLAEQALAD